MSLYPYPEGKNCVIEEIWNVKELKVSPLNRTYCSPCDQRHMHLRMLLITDHQDDDPCCFLWKAKVDLPSFQRQVLMNQRSSKVRIDFVPSSFECQFSIFFLTKRTKITFQCKPFLVSPRLLNIVFYAKRNSLLIYHFLPWYDTYKGREVNLLL
jgi:hypothetical protein